MSHAASLARSHATTRSVSEPAVGAGCVGEHAVDCRDGRTDGQDVIINTVQAHSQDVSANTFHGHSLPCNSVPRGCPSRRGCIDSLEPASVGPAQCAPPCTVRRGEDVGSPPGRPESAEERQEVPKSRSLKSTRACVSSGTGLAKLGPGQLPDGGSATEISSSGCRVENVSRVRTDNDRKSGRLRSRRGAEWQTVSPTEIHGSIKSARAFRLPPEVRAEDVRRRVTWDATTGELLEDTGLRPNGLCVLDAGRKLSSVRDLHVSVAIASEEAVSPPWRQGSGECAEEAVSPPWRQGSGECANTATSESKAVSPPWRPGSGDWDKECVVESEGKNDGAVQAKRKILWADMEDSDKESGLET